VLIGRLGFAPVECAARPAITSIRISLFSCLRCRFLLETVSSAHSSAGHPNCSPTGRSVLPKRRQRLMHLIRAGLGTTERENLRLASVSRMRITEAGRRALEGYFAARWRYSQRSKICCQRSFSTRRRASSAPSTTWRRSPWAVGGRSNVIEQGRPVQMKEPRRGRR
jgi:hypothetical protein